ncbi:MATE family efflux transporter [Defluviimonas sp. D31]|uniref:MATE family efflux transporter n=1 Tax=Defluviimonas sp. D31 TaxID=3083253 RepID=UPI00296E89E2|nr:MATE family efflux transporter [Defluviimonas sp. D31]MDW4551038.1 MATE family efflux transporter [Defluviimonas sp. D31]
MRAERGRFVTGSLMRHVVVMALSGALGLSFTFLIDFLALWWISRLGDEAMIAAVGMAGTIQFVVISVGIGMMIGAVALVSRMIGQGDGARARRIATVAVLLTVAVQATLAALIWIFREPLLAATGAEGAVLDHARTFLGLTLPSMPLMAAGIVCSSILRAAGDAWRSMAVTMVAGAVAAVLDPVLIVWSGWGVAGAGVSIFAARVVMCGIGLFFVIRVHDLLARPAREDVRTFLRPYLAIALPAIATQVSAPFGSWILTREVAEFGESAMAGWGVVMRLTILAFGGIFALSGAIGGIIGQNYGAGRPDRVAGAYWAALKFCAVYTMVTWALMAAMTGPIVASFGLSSEGAAIVQAFTHYAAGAFIFTGALFVANATFNNLARPLWSTCTNWFRDGVLMLPLGMAFTAATGAVGVIWANALANVIAGGVAAFLAWRYIRSLNRTEAVAAAAE